MNSIIHTKSVLSLLQNSVTLVNMKQSQNKTLIAVDYEVVPGPK